MRGFFRAVFRRFDSRFFLDFGQVFYIITSSILPAFSNNRISDFSPIDGLGIDYSRFTHSQNKSRPDTSAADSNPTATPKQQRPAPTAAAMAGATGAAEAIITMLRSMSGRACLGMVMNWRPSASFAITNTAQAAAAPCATAPVGNRNLCNHPSPGWFFSLRALLTHPAY